MYTIPCSHVQENQIKVTSHRIGRYVKGLTGSFGKAIEAARIAEHKPIDQAAILRIMLKD